MNEVKFETIKKIAEVNFKNRNIKNISKLDGSSPPSVFVGSKLKYPLVNVGILSPLQRDDNAWIYDSEKYWADNDFSINQVINLRDSLLNSRFQAKTHEVRLNNKFLDIAKEIAISAKPVDMEIELKRTLSLNESKDKILTPHGMKAPLKKARIVGNVTVHQKIDNVANDELKAAEGIKYLYKNNFDEYVLSKVLSVGIFGLKKDKKLVPTRWSITATDDILGKHLIEKIKDYKWIENYEFFVGGFMGNYYLIMLFPGIWSYELFELYLPGSSWNPSKEIKASTDLEFYSGRKEYASSTAGGYYAARLPIVEYLNKIKRQASVLAIRIETPSYWAALGVWVVRESVRKTLNNRVIEFKDKNEMMNSAKQISKAKFSFDPSQIIKQSKLLNQINTQKNLKEWF